MASAAALAKMVKSLYADGQVAYWLSPVVLHRGGSPFGRIQPGDSVIFCCRRRTGVNSRHLVRELHSLRDAGMLREARGA